MSGCRAESQATRGSSRCLMELTFQVATSMADTIAAARAARDAPGDMRQVAGTRGTDVRLSAPRQQVGWTRNAPAWQGFCTLGDTQHRCVMVGVAPEVRALYLMRQRRAQEGS